MTVDVVVYSLDPAAYGRMIVLERRPLKRDGKQIDTVVVVEIDPPDWRLAGGAQLDREEYVRSTETFLASELWPEEKWSGSGPDRDAAVAA